MEKLYLGINGHVVCINKTNGEQIWKTKLKSSTITNVLSDQGQIFAYAGGHLYCLNATNGNKLWENSLKGMGYGTCIFATEQQNASVIAAQVAAQQAVASSSTVTTGTTAES